MSDFITHQAGAAELSRHAILTGSAKPAPHPGGAFDPAAIPDEMRQAKRWLAFVWIRKDGRWQKMPTRWNAAAGKFVAGFACYKPEHAGDCLTLDELLLRMRQADPDADSLGLMFWTGPDADGRRHWVAGDLDGHGANDPVPELLRGAFESGAGYWCQSVSKGLRFVGWIDGKAIGGTIKQPIEMELKANGQPTITSRMLTPDKPATLELTQFWRLLESKLPKKPERIEYTPSALDLEPRFMERVVKAAASYISRIEAAIAGQRGHDAFFRVCCRIAGGFGLRGAEGFNLAAEWNRVRCVPPFNEDDLTRKWNEACKVTDGEFAKQRQPIEQDWQQQQDEYRHAKQTRWQVPNYTFDDDDPSVLGQSEEDKPAEQQAAEARPAAASAPESANARRTNDGRWIVLADDDRHDAMRAQVLRILRESANARVYQRGGRAVIVAEMDARIRWKDPESGEVIERGPEARATILAAENGHLLPLVSRYCAFRQVKRSKKGDKLVPARIPQPLLMSCRATPTELAPLRGLLHGPTYDALTDRVIADGGYHAPLGMELVAPLALNVPARVSQADARQAAERILRAYRFFPWPEAEDGQCIQRARLLVAMMTALLRWSFGPAPAVLIRAKAAGSGKSEISKSVSEIVHGCQPRIMPWVAGKHAEDEMRKQLCMLLASGETLVLLDNLDMAREVDSASLNALLTTEGAFTARELGRNSAGAETGGPNHLAVFMTGNAVLPVNDFGQRCLTIDLAGTDGDRRALDPAAFGEVGELLPYVRSHRKELLEALMIILRGHRQAGSPKASATHWGSFGAWLAACVHPVAWALGVDPLAGLHDQWTEGSSEGEGLAHLLRVWLEKYPGQSLLAAELKMMASQSVPHELRNGHAFDPDMAAALADACGVDDASLLSTKSIGRRLKAFAGSPRKGKQAAIPGRQVRLGDDKRPFCLMATEREGHDKRVRFSVAEIASGFAALRLSNPPVERKQENENNASLFQGRKTKPHSRKAADTAHELGASENGEAIVTQSVEGEALADTAAKPRISAANENDEALNRLSAYHAAKAAREAAETHLRKVIQSGVPASTKALLKAYAAAGRDPAELGEGEAFSALLYGVAEIVDGRFVPKKTDAAKPPGKRGRGRG